MSSEGIATHLLPESQKYNERRFKNTNLYILNKIFHIQRVDVCNMQLMDDASNNARKHSSSLSRILTARLPTIVTGGAGALLGRRVLVHGVGWGMAVYIAV